MIKQLFNLILFLFAVTQNLCSQFINKGEITVEKNTLVSVISSFENTSNGVLNNNGELYFYKDFVNNGEFLFLSPLSESSVNFVGNISQNITNNDLASFYNIGFNNEKIVNAFTLSGNFHVENIVDFSSGIVNNKSANSDFIFGNNAIHINTSDLSFIDGKVKKEGQSSFIFPIGTNNYYRSLETSAPENTNNLFSSQYFNSNSNDSYPHNAKRGIIEFIDDKEYWTLQREEGTDNVAVTLKWNNNTSSTEIIDAIKSRLHIARWDNNQNIWVDEGGVVDENLQTVSTVTSVSSFGVFALAIIKEDSILPGGIIVYNFLSTDDDGKNDFLRIDGLEKTSNSSIKIYNRNGVKVFESKDYTKPGNEFRGFSDGRATLGRGDKLPTGTYFYILEYTYQSKKTRKTGYLHINSKE